MSENRSYSPQPRPGGARRAPMLYVMAIGALVLIGIALLAFGGVRMEQASDRLGDTPSALAPPPDSNTVKTTGSISGGERSGPGPEQAPATPGAVDVPGAN